MLSSRQKYLSTTLQQTLQDLLMDESLNNNNVWRIDPTIQLPNHSRGIIPTEDKEHSIKKPFPNVARTSTGTQDLELLSTTFSDYTKSLNNHTLSSAVSPTTAQLSLRHEELLLAAAAESRMLHQIRTAAAVDRQRELMTGILQQQSSIRKTQFNDLFQQANNYKQLQLAQHQPKKDFSATLEALGTSLRKDSHYVDVSTIPDSNLVESFQRKTRGGVTEPFPEKLHRMLLEVEEAGNTDIISFFSHGRAFGVHDPDRFVDEVMCKYFKQTSYSSFRRQLNLYGFKRITTGPDAGGYYHELFLKGRANLAVYMRRVGVPNDKDQHKFRETSSGKDPDFYVMKSVTGPSKK